MKALSYGGEPPSRAEAERLLEVPTRLILEARERNPALAELDLEAALERLEHRWLPCKDLLIHLEAHPGPPESPTFVIAPGLGDHARRHLGLASALAERGYGALAVDRRGHGISEGRRGDATLEADLDVLELAIAHARGRSGGPVVLLGDSLGGIMSWYLLTREPDVEAAVCHCIGHPEVMPDPSHRYKQPILRALGRIAPQAPISVRQIADYDHVALDPVTKDYFDREVDGLFNFKVSARSVASYLGFRPQIPWEQVTTPVLVMIGAADRMVTPEFTRAAFDRAHPPTAQYVMVAGAGHQLFLDDLGAALGPLLDWAGSALPADVRG
jgi:alpha-beta hydrolase superfamily lysophospholipase